MSSLAKQYYTQEEYLTLERAAEYKSEYISGQIYSVAGAGHEHSLIVGNLFGSLWVQLRGRPCEVHSSDIRVKVNPTGLYTYPAVAVVCGEPQFEDDHVDTLTNPRVIVEVLSPSTEAYDRGEKFAHYRKLESLTDYVLVAQDKVRVEHYIRHADRPDLWVLSEISEPEGVLHLGSIDCVVAMADVYDRVDFGSSADAPSR